MSFFRKSLSLSGAFVLALVIFFMAGAGVAADSSDKFVIGFVSGDWASQDEWNAHPADMGHLPDYLPHRPLAGAEMGIGDAQYLGRGMKLEYVLENQSAKTVDGMIAAIDGLEAKGAKVILIDAQGDHLTSVSKAVADRDILLLNVSAYENNLRNADCRENLFHTIPSSAMLMDGLAQFLVGKKWLRVLVLQGPTQEDSRQVASFMRSAKRFGLKVSETRPFLLTQDPRARQVNRVEQLTAGDEDLYDVVFVADAHGEFSYRIPYATVLPRPVVGAHGLTPRAWHWSYLRHGAPQVNSRFEKKYNRRMNDRDWAAWIAVKAVSEAVRNKKSIELADIRADLLNQKLKLDAFKGGGYSFRPWDNQLRQPVLMVTDNWVASVTPLKAFLHSSNNLDTLGFDQPESKCNF